jgi:hypothetical protein
MFGMPTSSRITQGRGCCNSRVSRDRYQRTISMTVKKAASICRFLTRSRIRISELADGRARGEALIQAVHEQTLC